jgi:hypothetical protein
VKDGNVPPERRRSSFDTTELRRQVRVETEKAVRADEGTEGVRLIEGPMDGFLVREDAPALRSDWHESWPEQVASRNRPGRYVLTDSDGSGERMARWEEFASA